MIIGDLESDYATFAFGAGVVFGKQQIQLDVSAEHADDRTCRSVFSFVEVETMLLDDPEEIIARHNPVINPGDSLFRVGALISSGQELLRYLRVFDDYRAGRPIKIFNAVGDDYTQQRHRERNENDRFSSSTQQTSEIRKAVSVLVHF